MFDFLEEGFNTLVKTVDTVVDIATPIVTLGQYGDLNKVNISNVLATGMTIYELSDITGIAVDILEETLHS